MINIWKDIRQTKSKKQHQHLERNGYPFLELSVHWKKNIPCEITDFSDNKGLLLVNRGSMVRMSKQRRKEQINVQVSMFKFCFIAKAQGSTCSFFLIQSELLLMVHSYWIYIDENNIQTFASFSTQHAVSEDCFSEAQSTLWIAEDHRKIAQVYCNKAGSIKGLGMTDF